MYLCIEQIMYIPRIGLGIHFIESHPSLSYQTTLLFDMKWGGGRCLHVR